ncbi:MAG: tRNA (adenosine(37)-N6)-threonylcarbamoyltransferase complex dimerization subunit type 1 TsaB [Dehalococcoidales bacterium]|nr:tRNA (adenosine(37)-N6)-threonylcarbamoyltransferase complex dimerization subunit type 1 TsaB [Dehalococcoidales bacterium]
MLILGIDTSTRYASLALVEDGRILGEYTWECRHNHSVELIPALENLLVKTGLQIKDIGAIGVAIGPGSFNGLRVGLSVAKGIAFSLNIPIVGISSLEAIAFSQAQPGMLIAPIIKAGQGILSTAFFMLEDNELSCVKEPFLAKIEDVPELLEHKTILCGDIDDNTRQILEGRVGSRIVFPIERSTQAYGTNIAILANARLKASQPDNVHTLEPFYLKKPHITDPKNKSRGSASTHISSKAVIWDLDGVIVDSADYHLHAWQEAAKPLGIVFPADYFWKTFGTSNNSIVAGLNLKLAPDEIKTMISTKESLFRQMITEGIKPLPGAIDLIIGLKKRKISMAIASSAPLDNIRCILNTLGIRQYFRALVGEDDVSQGKPDPEVFLKAAEKLGVSPDKCVVVEDAIQGVKAAKKARMACLAVAGTDSADSLKEADLVVMSLACINTDELLGLIK